MSFAQEMKDFVAGYQAVSDVGQKKRASELDEKKINADIEYQNAKLDLDKQELALKSKSAAARAKLGGTPKPSEVRAQTRFEWEQEDRKKKKAIQEGEALADTLPPVSEEEDVYEPTAEYANGGVVAHYDGGGAVGSDEPIEGMETSPRPKARPVPVPEPRPQQAIPTEPQAAPAEAAPAAAPEAKPEAKPTTIFLEPAKEALNAVGEEFIADQSKPQAAVGDAKEDDKLPLQDYDTIMKTIDPKGELPEHLKTAAALGAAFEVVKDPQKRFRLAKGVLSSAKEQSQILGSLVPEALRAGHVEEACKLFNDACNKFPTGHQVVVTPIPQGFSYLVRDEKEQVVMKGNLTPEELMEMSGQVADGSLFMSEMAKFYKSNKGTGGSYTAALADVTTAYTAAASATENYKTISESDASDEEKRAAYDAAQKARKALAAADAQVRKLGLQGAKPLSDRQMALDLRSAHRVDEATGELAPPPGSALPVTPEGNETPAPAPAQGGKPAPTAIMESAKAALAKGADRAAVIKRLTDNGYSAEGL